MIVDNLQGKGWNNRFIRQKEKKRKFKKKRKDKSSSILRQSDVLLSAWNRWIVRCLKKEDYCQSKTFIIASCKKESLGEKY